MGTLKFHYRVKAKKGHTSDQVFGRGVPPVFTLGSKPKKRYTSDQGFGRGVPQVFTTGSKPKKRYTSDQGFGRGVPQVFTTGSRPEKGIPLIKAAVGGYPKSSLPGQGQKSVYFWK